MKTSKHASSAALLAIVFAGALLAGCATHSTIQSRKQERPGVFESLSPEFQSLVDHGQIRRGMDTNAVYIAWGQPGQITAAETDAGESTTWSYYGFYVQQANTWGWRHMYTSSYPINYISAQATFTNGIVKQWQTYPPPDDYAAPAN
jgi:hypothetical protein